ncbi:hypothetical protein TSOC_002331 [Tetrabaena socialis]|uniref:BRISC and BRCA1-A complex member 2 n=1 Tax=Tetrabaena socialis TaxID=47790 RepID=A0A2J8AEA1_9CHLO|nr:hypothetical protein TSOC_002331 [Tetrabaena socialis]|eukprot:PNH10829.1 hypothetical protein TSOC_002331 [Tetrabaena socialis]
MATIQQQVELLQEDLKCTAMLEPGLARVCTLLIPWCGRQLRWQLLLPVPGGGALDVVFDDDTFRPLCGPDRPQPLFPSSPHKAGQQPLSQQPHGPGGLRAMLRALAADPHRPGGLSGFLLALLDAYRAHQVARLEGAAARLPRLQFELSTLEVGPGAQLELLHQQARFALPLPPIDLRRLLELARMFGARVPAADAPPNPQGEAPQAAAQAPMPPPEQPYKALDASDPTKAAAAGAAAEDVLEPLVGPPYSDTAADVDGDRSNNMLGGGPGDAPGPQAPGVAGAGSQPQQLQQAKQEQLVLTALFRLPAGPSGDMADPELSLQPAQPLAPAPGSSAAAATSAPLSLAPPLLLPAWSPHMCLAEFLPLAAERLQAQVDAHCVLLASRHQVLEELGEMLLGPLELNHLGGNGLYAVAWEGNTVLVSVELGPRFPAEKPMVALQCARACLEGVGRGRSRQRHGKGLRVSSSHVGASSDGYVSRARQARPNPVLERFCGARTHQAEVGCAHGACHPLGVLLRARHSCCTRKPCTRPPRRQLSAPDAVAFHRDYPWSPRWAPREMAARIFNWLKVRVAAPAVRPYQEAPLVGRQLQMLAPMGMR